MAPALRGLGCLCGARRCPGEARTGVPEHRAPDGLALPRRLRRVPLDLARREHRRARASGRRRRRRLEAPVRGVHGLGRAELRRALVRALVAAGPLARALGLPQARPPRPPGLRWHDARERARLARGDVRLRRRARPARAVGAAHRPRARAGGLGLHDAGDRLRGPARRHAGAEGRWHPARRGALRDRARGRRAAAHRRRRAAHPGRGRPGDGCRARRRRARARRSRGDRERDARRSCTAACSRATSCRTRSRARPRPSATAAPACRSTSR